MLERTEIQFRDEPHLLNIINRIVSRVGRRIDESSPMVDGRLPDGSRVNAVIRPLAIDGPGLSIRRFGGHHFQIEDFIRNKTLTAEMAEFLRAAVLTRLNIIVSGGTGSGKTTLLNCLSTYLPPNQRIVTIEDAAELHCSSLTSSDWNRVPQTWRQKAKLLFATCSVTLYGCGPIA